ncbi:MAG: PDZ domain-containing protein, partial [Desulfuromonadales bacterium]|nr:PDZ domain-containing protein [Desulfuromonadales bacterium]
MTGRKITKWLIPLVGIALVTAGGVVAADAGPGSPPQAPKAASVPEPPEPPAPPEPPRAPEVHAFAFHGHGHAWLGVRISEVTPERAQELGLEKPTGAVVEEVVEGSPAAAAGLQKNDVVVEFDGEPVRSAAQLRRLVRETPAGRTVTLQVNRAGQRRSLEVQLEERRARVIHPSIRVPEIEIPDIGVFVYRRGVRLG